MANEESRSVQRRKAVQRGDLAFWRTIKAILCGDCLKHRDSAILARLFGSRDSTCERCGARMGGK